MEKNNNHKQSKINKNGKDILYKIGKVQQNKILKSKDHNIDEFQLQKQKQKHNLDFQSELIDQEEEEDQFYVAEFPNPKLQENHVQHPHQENQKIFCFDDDDDEQDIQLQDPHQKQEKKCSQQPIKQFQMKEEQINQNQKDEQKEGTVEKQQEKTKKFVSKYKNRQRGVKKQKNDKIVAFQEYSQDENQDESKNKNKNEGEKEEEIALSNESSNDSSDENIKGISIVSNPLEGNVNINIINKKQFMQSSLPPGIILKCIIRKSSSFFNPQFDIYLENGMKHIISAKKMSLAKNQIYKFYSQIDQFSEEYKVGSIIANTVHNLYWITEKQKSFAYNQCMAKGLVSYKKLVKGVPRQMNVLFFKKQSFQIDTQKLVYEGEPLIMMYNPLIISNWVKPEKDNSIKNVTLVDEEDKQYRYLNLQKISENMFSLIIQHPLSPYQAFAISLTRFDAELK